MGWLGSFFRSTILPGLHPQERHGQNTAARATEPGHSPIAAKSLPTKPPAPDWPRRALAIALSALVLAIAMALPLLRAPRAMPPGGAAASRHRAVVQALALLSPSAQAASVRDQSQASSASIDRRPDDGAAAAIGPPVEQLRALSASLLLSNARPAHAAQDQARDSGAQAPGAARGSDFAAPVPANHIEARKAWPIPDEIEGAILPMSVGDPLAATVVSGALRWGEVAAAPFRLLEVRMQSELARARLGYGASAAAAPAGWFEVGDAPAPGWRIVRIDRSSVDILTPNGNPIRLGAIAAESSYANRGFGNQSQP